MRRAKRPAGLRLKTVARQSSRTSMPPERATTHQAASTPAPLPQLDFDALCALAPRYGLQVQEMTDASFRLARSDGELVLRADRGAIAAELRRLLQTPPGGSSTAGSNGTRIGDRYSPPSAPCQPLKHLLAEQKCDLLASCERTAMHLALGLALLADARGEVHAHFGPEHDEALAVLEELGIITRADGVICVLDIEEYRQRLDAVGQHVRVQ
jgi:hypothetical protein